jgi:penicillin amidase
LPELLNPSQGYIITANNRVIGSNYPYHLSFDYCTGNRAERIEELIQERGKLSINDIREMQFDQISTQARRTAKILGQLQSTDPELKIIIDRLGSYDGNLSKASPEAAIYELFTQSLIQQLLKERLGDLAIHYCGKGTTPVLAESSILGERAREWLDRILGNPESPWYNLGNGESRDEIVLAVLKKTINTLKQKLGPKPQDWQWGRLHTLTFAHTLGSVKPLNLIFNRGPFALGGDFDTIWATGSSRYDLGQQGVVGPPFRFIADLSNWENCQGLLAPGQSGQPTNPHYADQLKSWFSGKYHPMIFAQSEVKKKAKKILIIRPINNE